MDWIVEWTVYYLTRPMCWLGFHPYSCRGLTDHYPLSGWHRESQGWQRF